MHCGYIHTYIYRGNMHILYAILYIPRILKTEPRLKLFQREKVHLRGVSIFL